jgi:hypothetical protein
MVWALEIVVGLVLGALAWLALRYGVSGFFMVEPNERDVLCSFGRATRIGNLSTLQDPVSQSLNADERERYVYRQVQVVQPGFHWRRAGLGLSRAVHRCRRPG